MVYYQVKQQYDQKRKPSKGYDIYIGGELYTKKEIEKQHLNMDYMKPIIISKRKPFWCFGSRQVSNDET